jgi:hypothetical protein
MGEDPFEKPMCRLKDNIKLDLKETRSKNINCIYLVHARVQWQASMNTIINLWVAQKTKYLNR